MIEEFRGEHEWLSNFHGVKIILDGIEYPSVEHAYMSAKSEDEEWKEYCSSIFNHAGQVKRKSKEIDLVKDWEDIKEDVMWECIQQKYSQEPFKSKLIETAPMFIQEGNGWGDTYWGVCLKTNKGKNVLGNMIMKFRNELVLGYGLNFSKNGDTITKSERLF